MKSIDMRRFLLARYPASTSWKLRVSKMSDGQVFAVYTHIILSEGKK